MNRWIAVDTRQLDAIRGLVDGFVHVLPQPYAGKHCLEMSCWCNPTVAWHTDMDALIVGHKRKRLRDGKDPAAVHTPSR